MELEKEKFQKINDYIHDSKHTTLLKDKEHTKFIKEESMNHDMATAQSVQKPGEHQQAASRRKPASPDERTETKDREFKLKINSQQQISNLRDDEGSFHFN